MRKPYDPMDEWLPKVLSRLGPEPEPNWLRDYLEELRLFRERSKDYSVKIKTLSL